MLVSPSSSRGQWWPPMSLGRSRWHVLDILRHESQRAACTAQISLAHAQGSVAQDKSPTLPYGGREDEAASAAVNPRCGSPARPPRGGERTSGAVLGLPLDGLALRGDADGELLDR